MNEYINSKGSLMGLLQASISQIEAAILLRLGEVGANVAMVNAMPVEPERSV